jgi:hypothetical protein
MMCRLLHHETGARCDKDRGHPGTTHYGYSHYPGQVVSWDEHARVDKRGRRIGYNWWREYNCSMLLDADLTWQTQAEAATMGYTTEMGEYRAEHPRPTLKAFLVANAGMNREPEGFPETEREQVIYLPTEVGLPVLEAERLNQK